MTDLSVAIPAKTQLGAEQMSLGEALKEMSVDKLRRILETNSWTLDELEAAIAETSHPEKLALLLDAVERLLERVRRLKKLAEKRLAEIQASAQPGKNEV